jgi:hypothetical protein
MQLACEISDDVMLWKESKLRRLKATSQASNKVEGKKSKKKQKAKEEKSLEARIDVDKLGKKASLATGKADNGPEEEGNDTRWESPLFTLAESGYEDMNSNYRA